MLIEMLIVELACLAGLRSHASSDLIQVLLFVILAEHVQRWLA